MCAIEEKLYHGFKSCDCARMERGVVFPPGTSLIHLPQGSVIPGHLCGNYATHRI